GIVDGTGQAVSDTIDGIKALGDWETWENMGNAALHPIDTLSTMYNVLSDSFINDVINGDAESRARWGSYALTQVGLGLIGDKGLSKASKLGQAGKVTKLAKNKIPQAISHITSNLQLGDRFALAGMGSMRIEIPTIKDYFVKSSSVKSKGLNNKTETNLEKLKNKHADIIEKHLDNYAAAVNSNSPWKWRKISGGEKLTAPQKAIIKQVAIEKGLIPDVPMKLGTQYPDFKKAGLIIKSDELPEEMWLASDKQQFKWLDDRIPGGRPPGTTWHHSEIPGKMELVPFGIHNSIFHKGGRSEGHWSYRSKGR
ncbi:HNH endonuclease, partial [Bacillus cereus group sp. N12]|nr:HNH endonuclease [Bacillus cereus group sp. N12]